MSRIKRWVLRYVFKIRYVVGVDIAEKNGDKSCKVLAMHNLKTGQITILKVEYF